MTTKLIPEVIITLGPDGYLVTYGPGRYGDEVEELFDTRTIPTPYTAAAAGERVAKDIAARHPGWRVVCAY